MAVSQSRIAELDAKAASLNEQFDKLTATQILARLIHGRVAGSVAVISSFGAEAACLLSLVAEKDPNTPVIFLDTRKHFNETLAYAEDLMDQLSLTTLVRVRPSLARIAAEDSDLDLHRRDADRCCYIRKTLPMIGVLRNFDVVMTGRKRFQTNERRKMPIVERQETWLKVNPLADWTRDRVRQHLRERNILEHPLVSQGYASIGCAPCTEPSEDPRAGRWAAQSKTECGIHISEDGNIVRVPASEQ